MSSRLLRIHFLATLLVVISFTAYAHADNLGKQNLTAGFKDDLHSLFVSVSHVEFRHKGMMMMMTFYFLLLTGGGYTPRMSTDIEVESLEADIRGRAIACYATGV